MSTVNQKEIMRSCVPVTQFVHKGPFSLFLMEIGAGWEQCIAERDVSELLTYCLHIATLTCQTDCVTVRKCGSETFYLFIKYSVFAHRCLALFRRSVIYGNSPASPFRGLPCLTCTFPAGLTLFSCRCRMMRNVLRLYFSQLMELLPSFISGKCDYRLVDRGMGAAAVGLCNVVN